MRLWTLCAVGSLATISAAALAQFAVHKMTRIPIEELMRIRPVIVQPAPPPPPQAPQIQFRGCVYYEHNDWQGKWRSIPGGTRRMVLGASWDNQISSFACSQACRVVAFDQNFKGERVEFPTVRAVGANWNDKISSMIAACQHPF